MRSHSKVSGGHEFWGDTIHYSAIVRWLPQVPQCSQAVQVLPTVTSTATWPFFDVSGLRNCTTRASGYASQKSENQP